MVKSVPYAVVARHVRTLPWWLAHEYQPDATTPLSVYKSTAHTHIIVLLNWWVGNFARTTEQVKPKTKLYIQSNAISLLCCLLGLSLIGERTTIYGLANRRQLCWAHVLLHAWLYTWVFMLELWNVWARITRSHTHLPVFTTDRWTWATGATFVLWWRRFAVID